MRFNQLTNVAPVVDIAKQQTLRFRYTKPLHETNHELEDFPIAQSQQPPYEAGAHLRVSFGLYQHHGIALGDDTVIHFGRVIFDLENAIVEQVDLETFSQGKPIQVVDSAIAFSPDEIAVRATRRLGNSDYDLISNNCEHFVTWCRSGKNESQQSNLGETVARQSVAIAAKPMLRRWIAKRASKRLGAVAVGLSRGPVVAASLGDAVQATTEIVANRTGQSRAQSQKMGQGAGLASSVALGWALGGPFTAVAGVGFWVAGQVAAIRTVETGKQVISEAMSRAKSKQCNPEHSTEQSGPGVQVENV